MLLWPLRALSRVILARAMSDVWWFRYVDDSHVCDCDCVYIGQTFQFSCTLAVSIDNISVCAIS